jgi:hypothetical protein
MGTEVCTEISALQLVVIAVILLDGPWVKLPSPRRSSGRPFSTCSWRLAPALRRSCCSCG